jgi:5,10-methylene-tetrahydrofolate dehydrogenase/methenyl tetrahydrofolate cyclohydrolase
MASIIDGKAVAKEVQKQIKEEVDGLERRWGMAPGLGVILVGDDPGSHIYVKNKEKACKEVGIKSFEHLLPATISERELLALVNQLNKDKSVHGILVQLPTSGRKEFWKRFLRIRMLTGFIPSARECWCLAAMASGRARRWAS